jgi:hypothetical protein
MAHAGPGPVRQDGRALRGRCRLRHASYQEKNFFDELLLSRRY